MQTANIKVAVSDTANIFGNGRGLLLLVFLAALVGVTVLGALGRLDEQVISTLYSAVIFGAIGQANGNLQGRLAAEREQLLAQTAKQTTEAK
jgi:hypothetical protein